MGPIDGKKEGKERYKCFVLKDEATLGGVLEESGRKGGRYSRTTQMWN
jgi:hypothetical protein